MVGYDIQEGRLVQEVGEAMSVPKAVMRGGTAVLNGNVIVNVSSAVIFPKAIAVFSMVGTRHLKTVGHVYRIKVVPKVEETFNLPYGGVVVLMVVYLEAVQAYVMADEV